MTNWPALRSSALRDGGQWHHARLHSGTRVGLCYTSVGWRLSVECAAGRDTEHELGLAALLLFGSNAVCEERLTEWKPECFFSSARVLECQTTEEVREQRGRDWGESARELLAGRAGEE